MELQTKSNLIVELESNLNHATKQLESNKAKIQVFESESRSKEEKIQTFQIRYGYEHCFLFAILTRIVFFCCNNTTEENQM